MAVVAAAVAVRTLQPNTHAHAHARSLYGRAPAIFATPAGANGFSRTMYQTVGEKATVFISWLVRVCAHRHRDSAPADTFYVRRTQATESERHLYLHRFRQNMYTYGTERVSHITRVRSLTPVSGSTTCRGAMCRWRLCRPLAALGWGTERDCKGVSTSPRGSPGVFLCVCVCVVLVS